LAMPAQHKCRKKKIARKRKNNFKEIIGEKYEKSEQQNKCRLLEKGR